MHKTNKWNKAKFIFEKPSPEKSFANSIKPAPNCSWSPVSLPSLFLSLSVCLIRRLLNGLSGNHWHRARNDNNRTTKVAGNTKKRQRKISERSANKAKSSGKNWEEWWNERSWGWMRDTGKNWELRKGAERHRDGRSCTPRGAWQLPNSEKWRNFQINEAKFYIHKSENSTA